MKRRSVKLLFGSTLAVFSFFGIEETVVAEPTNKAAAETLFVDARKLIAAGKYAEACKALAESQRLDPGVGTLLNLGRCYDKMGRTASAWTTFREAAAAARSAGQAAREKAARQAADALEPKLSKLTVVVTDSSMQGLEVRQDGSAVPASLWGMSVAIDPGEHAFEASAPGYKTWQTRVTVAAGKPVSVRVPALEPDPSAAVAETAPQSQPSTPAAKKAPEKKPAEAPAAGGGNAQRVAALVVGGAGLVGAGVGGFFAWRAKSTYGAADCDQLGDGQTWCTYQGKLDQNRAFTQANIATYVTVGAGVALAASVVLWLTAPSQRSSESARTPPTKPRLWVSADPVGASGTRSLTLTGVF